MQTSAVIIKYQFNKACMGLNGLCVKQLVKLAAMRVTSSAAPRASLVQWVCTISNGLQRNSLDCMVTVTRVYCFKNRVRWKAFQ